MSSKRGDINRTRAQRHQNKTSFKNDLHDNSEKTKKLNAMFISEVCIKCKEVIEWKIKYRKYKQLTQPKICNRCNQRNVRKAYHVLCHDCAVSTKKCAKCLKPESENIEIIPAEPTEMEKIRMDTEMKNLMKTLSERKRRTLLRFMNGKKKTNQVADDEEEKEIVRPTKNEVLIKMQQLNATNDEDDDFYDDILSSEEEEK